MSKLPSDIKPMRPNYGKLKSFMEHETFSKENLAKTNTTVWDDEELAVIRKLRKAGYCNQVGKHKTKSDE